MRDPLFDDGPLALYRQTPERKNWDNPTPKEVAESLKKAHASNRTLEATVNELYDSKKLAAKEIAGLQRDLKHSQTRERFLTSLITSICTSGVIGGIIAIFKLWHG